VLQAQQCDISIRMSAAKLDLVQRRGETTRFIAHSAIQNEVDIVRGMK